MMTDGDVSARERAEESAASIDGNLAGHVAIVELLRAQQLVPPRSRIARIFGLSPLSPETQALYRGVVGEIEVGEALDRLGPEWGVLHALPVDVDSADIDHLVIGPAGVFIVMTKNHTGLNVWASQRTFMVAGIRQPHIRNMESEMGRAERILSSASGRSVEVAGILAVVAPKSLVVRERHRDVAVLAANSVVPWLHRHARALEPAEVSIITAAAGRASTWFQAGEQSEQPQSVRGSFEELRSDVRKAWRTQLAWAIGISILGIGSFVAITYSILMNALGAFGS
jgi:hypothetical protein